MNLRRTSAPSALISAGMARIIALTVVLIVAVRTWAVGAGGDYLTDVWTADNGRR